ncbi:ankyrin repeat domain-containing protein [Candidatus Dependentiae bacterium]|nr:ankyrin repeat domain-containing protein [Candidatus Dependentiae bacterium]
MINTIIDLIKNLFYVTIFIVTPSLIANSEANNYENIFELLPSDILGQIIFPHLLKLKDKTKEEMLENYRSYIKLMRNKIFCNYLDKVIDEKDNFTRYQNFLRTNFSEIDFKNFNQDIFNAIKFNKISKDLHDLIYLMNKLKKFDLNIIDELGWTSLMHACQEGNYETVKLLLSTGANFNEKDKRGSTALMKAISYNKIVTLLIDHATTKHISWNINETDSDGWTALRRAQHGHYLESVRVIKEAERKLLKIT